MSADPRRLHELDPGAAVSRRRAVAARMDPTGATSAWQRTSPRRISPEARRRFVRQLAELLEALGLPLDTPGTRRTPERLFDALVDATDGYEGDARALTSFPSERDRAVGGAADQVVEGPIRFEALCEHHALPFLGEAWVGYVPRGTIIGISKLTRIVRVFARRFTVQERLAREVTDALHTVIAADGAAILITASHTCTRLRGVREAGASTATTSFCGVYERDASLRAAFLALATRARDDRG
jgi:GTP cyclohydrolase I